MNFLTFYIFVLVFCVFVTLPFIRLTFFKCLFSFCWWTSVVNTSQRNDNSEVLIPRIFFSIGSCCPSVLPMYKWICINIGLRLNTGRQQKGEVLVDTKLWQDQNQKQQNKQQKNPKVFIKKTHTHKNSNT